MFFKLYILFSLIFFINPGGGMSFMIFEDIIDHHETFSLILVLFVEFILSNRKNTFFIRALISLDFVIVTFMMTSLPLL